DGSEPTAQSPAYSKPIALSTSAKLRARQFDSAGNPGSEASADFDVNDTTPPSVRSVTAISIVPTMRIVFSEPLEKSSAENPSNYRIDPQVPVKSAALSEDGTVVTLTLSKPLRASANYEYQLRINGVSDASPAANKVKPSDSLGVAVARPVFSLDTFK